MMEEIQYLRDRLKVHNELVLEPNIRQSRFNNSSADDRYYIRRNWDTKFGEQSQRYDDVMNKHKTVFGLEIRRTNGCYYDTGRYAKYDFSVADVIIGDQGNQAMFMMVNHYITQLKNIIKNIDETINDVNKVIFNNNKDGKLMKHMSSTIILNNFKGIKHGRPDCLKDLKYVTEMDIHIIESQCVNLFLELKPIDIKPSRIIRRFSK